ncbi:trimethylamine methyltransferase family protein [Chloroflexota bacterium]
MAKKGFQCNFAPIKLLSEDQVDEIHRSTLRVLEETGLKIEHERALKLLAKNGCKVDFDTSQVKFPPRLVEECLQMCPKSFRVRARNPENDLILGENTLYFGTSPGMDTVDLDTWEARRPTKKEFYDATTLTDALDNPHITMNYYPWFGWDELPPNMCIPEGFAARVRNTSKPLCTAYSNNCEIFTIQMAQAVGAEAFLAPYASAPLTYYGEGIEALFRIVEAGFPMRCCAGETMGATAPATVAGAIVSSSATALATLVLTQCIRPGARVATLCGAFSQNMKSGLIDFGSIQESLHRAAFIQYWRWLKIPTMTLTTFTNSKSIDFQNGYERAIATTIGALSGVNILQTVGCIYGELTLHPLQIVLDDDIANMVGRFIEGIKVDEETLAVDLIHEVGPIPGMHLDKAHTRKWWQSEGFITKAADKLGIAEWMATGKKNSLDYAQERMEKILATYKPLPLTPRQEEDIDRILKECWEYYRKKDML